MRGDVVADSLGAGTFGKPVSGDFVRGRGGASRKRNHPCARAILYCGGIGRVAKNPRRAQPPVLHTSTHTLKSYHVAPRLPTETVTRHFVFLDCATVFSSDDRPCQGQSEPFVIRGRGWVLGHRERRPSSFPCPDSDAPLVSSPAAPGVKHTLAGRRAHGKARSPY